MIKPFTYDVAKKNNSVVVIGGGVSAVHNFSYISEYIRNNNSTVFAANYNRTYLPVYYTYFTDKHKFKENIHSITTPTVIVASHMIELAEKFKNDSKSNIDFYFAGVSKLNKEYPYKIKAGPYESKNLAQLTNGVFLFKAIGTAGFGCMALATLCRPKTMLIAGFDGQTPDQKYRVDINGKYIPFKIDETVNTFRKQKFLHKVLIPFITSKGITIETFQNDSVWQANKTRLGIKVIH